MVAEDISNTTETKHDNQVLTRLYPIAETRAKAEEERSPALRDGITPDGEMETAPENCSPPVRCVRSCILHLMLLHVESMYVHVYEI